MIFFLFFLENRIDITCRLSLLENLHEMSKPVSGKKKKNISKCHLKFLPRVLIIKCQPNKPHHLRVFFSV